MRCQMKDIMNLLFLGISRFILYVILWFVHYTLSKSGNFWVFQEWVRFPLRLYPDSWQYFSKYTHLKQNQDNCSNPTVIGHNLIKFYGNKIAPGHIKPLWSYRIFSTGLMWRREKCRSSSTANIKTLLILKTLSTMVTRFIEIHLVEYSTYII